MILTKCVYKIIHYVMILSLFFISYPDLHAEVILDGTLGTKGGLTGPDYTVTSGMGQQYGGNLFHSFSTFNLTSVESATFTGPNSIVNIISRVTGGEASNMDGLLRSTIEGANLYLINPSGVVFGQNATIDVSGSFHVSTADYIRLGDSGRFNATGPGSSILTSVPPSAFGFLNDNPGDVSINGTLLQVPEGEIISLVGGDIYIQDSNLYAPDGSVNLVSVVTKGEAILSPSNSQVDSFGRFGNIDIIDTRPEAERPVVNDQLLGNIDVSGTGGGNIFIRGGEFVIDGGLISAETYGDEGGASIDIKIEGDMMIHSMGVISSIAMSGTGRGGDITIETGNLDIFDIGGINASTWDSSEGDAGNITIKANNSFTISGYYNDGITAHNSSIFSDTYGKGKGGDIDIETGNLRISDGGVISTGTLSGGEGGDITIKANDSITISDPFTSGNNVRNSGIYGLTSGVGKAGDIDITARNLGISNAGTVNTMTLGTGDGGNITIRADDSISISGYYDNGKGVTSSAIVSSQTLGKGRAGNISIETGTLNISDGGIINAGTWGSSEGDAGDITIKANDSIKISGYYNDGIIAHNSSILSDTFGNGKGGNIDIETGNLRISDGGVISASTISGGDGGNITIKAIDSITISDPFTSGNDVLDTGIYGFTSGEGKAGDIDITTRNLGISNAGTVNTMTLGTGDGGNITIRADDSISISGYYDSGNGYYLPSHIGSQTVGRGTGGTITLYAKTLNMGNKGRLSVESKDSGDAGSIAINVNDIIRLQDSSVITATKDANGGDISINSGHMIDLIDSSLSATVHGGTGNGGNMKIESAYVILDKSKIIANAEGGNGGNISIVVEEYIPSPTSIVSASSRLGIDGTIVISSPAIDISGNLAVLPSSYIDTEALFPKQCVEREEEISNFVIKGRDGLPPQPDRLLTSP